MKSGYVILEYSTATMGPSHNGRYPPSAYREAYLASQTPARRKFIEGRPWSSHMLDDRLVMIKFNCWMSDDQIDELLDLFDGCRGKIDEITTADLNCLAGRV